MKVSWKYVKISSSIIKRQSIQKRIKSHVEAEKSLR